MAFRFAGAAAPMISSGVTSRDMVKDPAHARAAAAAHIRAYRGMCER